MYIYLVALNRAIRPGPSSHYIPLVFVLSRRDQLYLFRNDLIRRHEEDTLPLHLQFLFKPHSLCFLAILYIVLVDSY